VAQYRGKYRYAKDEESAKQKLYEMLAGAEESKPANVTVEVVLEEYLNASMPNLKPRTVTRYRLAIDAHLIPAFGRMKLHKLTASDIERVYARKLGDGQSPASIRLMHTVLSSAIKREVRLQRVQTNVCSGVQLPRLDRDEVEVFQPSEVQALLTAASQDRLEALWVLALNTGARVSELVGLQVQDYDPAMGTLDICRSVHDGAVGTVKSKRSKRKITLPAIAREALDRHLTREHSSIWMFHNSQGKPFWYSFFRTYRWMPLLKRAGVPYRTFHVCRHTVASNLLSNPQLPIPAIAAYLGHDVQTLLRTYAHCLPDQMQDVAAAMDAKLSQQSAPLRLH